MGGETYPHLSLREEHVESDGIGLLFLSRHLVTLDFPKQTMYLKRTSIGPLIDKDMEAAGKATAKAAMKFLKSLKEKDRLPGWSKNDELATDGVTFHFHFPGSLTLNLLKKGDSSIYHYEFTRASKAGPWKLLKARRTEQSGRTIEEYHVP
jgi:hypothetical protein